ncbi:hypothetical protein M5689_006953 [Euphorbia peplus]|nr:hypothetical protein M5689_006953 [Euphorbia peplus]
MANSDLNGFRVAAINRGALVRLNEEKPRFWETSEKKGAALVKALNTLGRALRLSYSDYTWRQLSDAQLKTIIKGYEAAVDSIFFLPVPHYRRLGRAREVLARRPLEKALEPLRGDSKNLIRHPAYKALLINHPIDINLDEPLSQIQPICQY